MKGDAVLNKQLKRNPKGVMQVAYVPQLPVWQCRGHHIFINFLSIIFTYVFGACQYTLAIRLPAPPHPTVISTSITSNLSTLCSHIGHKHHLQV